MLGSRRLRHFVVTYELGSIGQAAEKLLLTQPALSKSIRQLEDELGVQLFERTTMGVTPTAFGNALAAHARVIEAESRRAETTLASMRGKAKGRVGVGVGPSVAAGLIVDAVAGLRRAGSEIELMVTEGLVDTVIPMLRRSEIDVAVGAWPRVVDPAFATELLVADRLEVVAGPGHALAGRRAELAQLSEQVWALPPHDQRWRQAMDEAFHAAGVPPPRPRVVSNSGAFLVALIAGGEYLSYLPRQLVERAGLVAVETPLPDLRPEVTATYRERSLTNPAIREVVDAVRAAAGVT